MTTRFRTVDVDGTEIFYREAGDRSRAHHPAAARLPTRPATCSAT